MRAGPGAVTRLPHRARGAMERGGWRMGGWEVNMCSGEPAFVTLVRGFRLRAEATAGQDGVAITLREIGGVKR